MEKELEQLIKGEWLGTGINRYAHVYNLDPKYVVKIAHGEWGRQNNLIEARIWYEIQNSMYAKWFAPVLDVSRAGGYLIMERAEMGKKKDYPTKVPHFFTDLKYNNFGWIGDQFVSVDYANLIITTCIGYEMKKAKWWDK